MIAHLAQNYISGGSSLTVSLNAAKYFGNIITVINLSNIKDNSIIDPNLITIFSVGSVSGDTFNGLTKVWGESRNFLIGDVVVDGIHKKTIIDDSSFGSYVDDDANRSVLTSDRYNNPDFIQSLDYSKITNSPSWDGTTLTFSTSQHQIVGGHSAIGNRAAIDNL